MSDQQKNIKDELKEAIDTVIKYDEVDVYNNSIARGAFDNWVDEVVDKRVNSPAHYNWISGIECLDVAEHFNFNLGNAVKYIWRSPYKGSEEEQILDLTKAKFYLSREIDRIKGNIR